MVVDEVQAAKVSEIFSLIIGFLQGFFKNFVILINFHAGIDCILDINSRKINREITGNYNSFYLIVIA